MEKDNSDILKVEDAQTQAAKRNIENDSNLESAEAKNENERLDITERS